MSNNQRAPAILATDEKSSSVCDEKDVVDPKECSDCKVGSW